MKFYFFHLMPWPHLPADFSDKSKHPSAWVTLSNRFYDPEKGHLLYNRYLDELEYAEKLGFDGVCVNEHHQNAYGTMPAPNIVAATLVRRTNRMKIAIVGNGLPLRDHPLRVAEEVAMLDVISGGRIISRFVRGIGDEYYSMGINPTFFARTVQRSSRPDYSILDEARSVRVRGATLSSPLCERMASPTTGTSSADLDTWIRQQRDSGMVR
jgi:hypothetical protein